MNGRPFRSAPSLTRLLLISFLAFHPSSFGWAAHPFITDDTGTQGAGHWQLELMAEHGRHGVDVQQRSTRSTLFNSVLTYGLLDTLDLAVGASYLRHRASENGVSVDEASGPSDSTLELKWRFYDRDGLSFAVKPALSLPTGDENRGLGTGLASWAVNFIGTLAAAPWTGFANLAYAHPRYKLAQDAAGSREHLWRLSAGATYDVSETVRLAAEAGVRTNETRNDPFRPGRQARFAMLGAIYSPHDKLDFDIGVRKALNRAETDTVLLVGATLRW